jgi:hypothetical protein
MIKRILVLAVIFFSGCATRLPTDYAGPDAGRVVIGMGAGVGLGYSRYTLLFRKRASPGEDGARQVGAFNYIRPDPVFGKAEPDYRIEYKEEGVVLVQSLPAGDYEIYNCDIHGYGGKFFFTHDVSIPFSVKPGRTVYLGNYLAKGRSGKNLVGVPVHAGVTFVVSDRLGSDMPLAQARSKLPLGTGDDATPDHRRIGSPFFASPLEEPEVKWWQTSVTP